MDPEDLRGIADLEKVYASLNESNVDLWGVENISLHEKIVNIFQLSEEAQNLIQVLAKVGPKEPMFGMHSISPNL